VGDGRGHPLGGVHGDVRDDHSRAAPGQFPAQRLADPGACASHDGYLVAERTGHGHSHRKKRTASAAKMTAQADSTSTGSTGGTPWMSGVGMPRTASPIGVKLAMSTSAFAISARG